MREKQEAGRALWAPRRTFRALAAAGLLLLPASAASGQDRAEGFGVSGDWGGLRQRLHDRGVDPFARYVAGVWSNLRGGFATGARYEGFAYWGFDLDLAELAGWNGARFHMSLTSYHGGQTTDDLIGAFKASTVSGLEAERSFRFLEIYAVGELLRGRIDVKVGQLIADRDFFSSEYAEVFRNATLGSFSVGRASPFAPFYPVAAPGAVVTARFGEGWRTRFGVYTADPGLDVSSNIGFDWGFDNGAIMLGDATVERRPFGLPASYTVGGIFATAPDIVWEAGRLVDENHAFYGMVDQALLLDAEGDVVLGAFFRLIFVPRKDRSIQRWYGDAGVAWTGPLPGRDRDVLALALVYSTLSRDYLEAAARQGLNRTNQQTTVELTYRARLADWMRVQPSLQLFFDPHESRRNAVVLGLQAVIDL